MSWSTVGSSGSEAGLGIAGTMRGAATLRNALERFGTLILLALTVSILVFVQDLLRWTGVLSQGFPSATTPVAVWWSTHWDVVVVVALGLTIAALVIAGIVIAIQGLVSWRRGVNAMRDAAPEYGPAQIEAARQARADHTTTLWLFLAFVAAAIVVSIGIGVVNFALDRTNTSRLPDEVGSIVSGLATSAVLVTIYYFGARHLAGFLSVISGPEGRKLLETGRTQLLVGALVGLGASLTALSWAFGAAAIASLVIVYVGAINLRRAYTLWLGGNRVAPPAPFGRVPTPS